MTTWLHARKGRIVGEIVRADDTWTQIRLTGDHQLRYMSELHRGRVDASGDILTVRTSLIREIGDTSDAAASGFAPRWDCHG